MHLPSPHQPYYSELSLWYILFANFRLQSNQKTVKKIWAMTHTLFNQMFDYGMKEVLSRFDSNLIVNVRPAFFYTKPFVYKSVDICLIMIKL